MELITINPNNEPYYSEDFIKGFKCGAQRQFEADKADRPQGEWIKTPMTSFWVTDRIYKCSVCGNTLDFYGVNANRGDANFCPNCGARMKGADDE